MMGLADDLKDWAIETKHSTSKEAAILAKNAKVKQLILTHISSRYSENAEPLLVDARGIFKKVKLAEEFMEIEIPLSDK
jgi:ribonuclease Z